MYKITLSQSDRRFFGLVADAAFTNPFSEKRETIDSEIAGLTGQKDSGLPWADVVSLMIKKLEARLAELDKMSSGGTAKLEDFDGETDRELMKYAFLFAVFHQAARDFDALIRKQERAEEKTLTVSFAPKTLEQMFRRGFSPQQASRCFALFYQIRRAFYFIQQGLIGKSNCMRKLRMDLWNNIFTYDIRGYEQYLWDRMEDFATLLEGPTGCGKGAAAAAVGKSCFIPFDAASNTFQSSFMELFVPANLSQYAPTLLESELFGHTRGAFTGAVSEHEGLFGLCRPHGTIFLDEIGEISPQVQVKLLKVLEERAYTPVGSHKTKHFYGRVIAATNRPVALLRRDGVFREDFYYRLCADCIVVPSLAQRVQENPQELVELVEHFARQITRDYNPKLCDKVLEVIRTRLPKGYGWPGNVRELAQCIRRVILKEDYQPTEIAARTRAEQIKDGLEKGVLSADQLVSEYCKLLYDKHPSYQDVARIAGLDWRTAKKKVIES
ncbi:MAG: sigma-54-dependent Fis family transcriptional regulator [Planctomycetes bacterium]|nr:sigma-54-dependent Fis family transcriptional regulator [Planctomycetota bacterium]